MSQKRSEEEEYHSAKVVHLGHGDCLFPTRSKFSKTNILNVFIRRKKKHKAFWNETYSLLFVAHLILKIAQMDQFFHNFHIFQNVAEIENNP